MAKNNLQRKLHSGVTASADTRQLPVMPFRILLPEGLADRYEDQARTAGLEQYAETVILNRLERCVEHTAEKPLYATDDQRRRIEELMNYNFDADTVGTQQLIERLTKLVEVRIAGDNEPTLPLTVCLTPQQLERLRGQCHYGKTMDQRISEIITDAINVETGLY